MEKWKQYAWDEDEINSQVKTRNVGQEEEKYSLKCLWFVGISSWQYLQYPAHWKLVLLENCRHLWIKKGDNILDSLMP